MHGMTITQALTLLLSLPTVTVALRNPPPVSPIVYTLAIKSAHTPLSNTHLSLNTTSGGSEIGIFPSAPPYQFSIYHTSRSPLDINGQSRLYTILPRDYPGPEKVAMLVGGRGKAVLKEREQPVKGDGSRWEGWLGREGEKLGYAGEEGGQWWAVPGGDGGWRVEQRGDGVVSTAVGQKIEIEVVRMN